MATCRHSRQQQRSVCRTASVHQHRSKIKSNIMRITTENGRRTARGTTRGSPLPLVSTQSGEPGDAVDRAGVVLQRRIAFAATPYPSRVYDEPKKPDNPRG